jgi:hypothetical protein
MLPHSLKGVPSAQELHKIEGIEIIDQPAGESVLYTQFGGTGKMEGGLFDLPRYGVQECPQFFTGGREVSKVRLGRDGFAEPVGDEFPEEPAS